MKNLTRKSVEDFDCMTADQLAFVELTESIEKMIERIHASKQGLFSSRVFEDGGKLFFEMCEYVLDSNEMRAMIQIECNEVWRDKLGKLKEFFECWYPIIKKIPADNADIERDDKGDDVSALSLEELNARVRIATYRYHLRLDDLFARFIREESLYPLPDNAFQKDPLAEASLSLFHDYCNELRLLANTCNKAVLTSKHILRLFLKDTPR